MKIGLFGDSFGVQKRNEPFNSWVTLLSQHYGIINHCESGVGEYKILKQLLNSDLTEFDYIIVTHTSSTRIHVEHNPIHRASEYHKNCDIIYADIAERQDEFSVACQLYFKHIFDINYATFVHNAICEKIDKLLDNKKVIHITHFDYAGLYSFRDLINFHQLFLKNRGEVNHYNEDGNTKVYEEVYKRLLCLK